MTSWYVTISKARSSEGHIAVRFGDVTKGERWEELRAFLDGRDVSNDCTEANVDEGWVMLKSWPRASLARHHGTVRLEGIARP